MLHHILAFIIVIANYIDELNRIRHVLPKIDQNIDSFT